MRYLNSKELRLKKKTMRRGRGEREIKSKPNWFWRTAGDEGGTRSRKMLTTSSAIRGPYTKILWGPLAAAEAGGGPEPDDAMAWVGQEGEQGKVARRTTHQLNLVMLRSTLIANMIICRRLNYLHLTSGSRELNNNKKKTDPSTVPPTIPCCADSSLGEKNENVRCFPFFIFAGNTIVPSITLKEATQYIYIYIYSIPY